VSQKKVRVQFHSFVVSLSDMFSCRAFPSFGT